MNWFQEKAQRVSGKLPAKALCLICSQSGEGEEKPAGAILLNGETIWQAWGVKSVPSVLLVKDGQVLQHWSRQIDIKEIERAVQARL